MKGAAAVVGLWLLTAPPLVAEVTEPGECAPCHPAAKVRWRSGVHAAEGMVCSDCHGGVPAAAEAAAGHSGMRWFKEAEEILEVCGGCHAETSFIRPYNLAVDQLALYRESGHGRARLAGDERAPICVDCHDNHRVLTAADAASPTFAANLPRTCGSCHADVDLTTELGLDGGAVEGFTGGPHGRALRTREPRLGPSCATCHDGHGAAVPLNPHVDEVCGNCHADTRASLRSGSHRSVVERKDLAGCASCHPVHGGLRARPPAMICVDCHEDDSSQIALGAEVQTLLRQAEEEVAKAEAALFKAHRVPLEVRDHEALVLDARVYLREARSQLHTFRREPIEELARASRSIASKVRTEIDHKLDRKSARTVLYFTWFYAVVTLGVLGRFRWRALHRSKR